MKELTMSTEKIDATVFYCPYIPVTISGTVRIDKVLQNGLLFEMHVNHPRYEEIVDWLRQECTWGYKMEPSDNYRWTEVTFTDAKGAMEFKLRFCD